jgi:hypothetical protein
MAELWGRFSPFVPQLMQQMAIYFVQFRPRVPGTTLYCKLVRAIEKAGARERLLLSTLNYECLLEHSIWEAKVPVNYGDFPNRDGITVWKLHGACNFLPADVSAIRSVSYTSAVGFGTPMRPARDLNEVLEFCLGDNALPPVMCLFMPGKPVQVSAGSISNVQAQWQEKVAAAKQVAVVGVYPNPEDTHVWDTLANSTGELFYVGAAAPFDEWTRAYRSARPSKVLGEHFDTAFDTLLHHMVP